MSRTAQQQQQQTSGGAGLGAGAGAGAGSDTGSDTGSDIGSAASGAGCPVCLQAAAFQASDQDDPYISPLLDAPEAAAARAKAKKAALRRRSTKGVVIAGVDPADDAALMAHVTQCDTNLLDYADSDASISGSARRRLHQLAQQQTRSLDWTFQYIYTYEGIARLCVCCSWTREEATDQEEEEDHLDQSELPKSITWVGKYAVPIPAAIAAGVAQIACIPLFPCDKHELALARCWHEHDKAYQYAEACYVRGRVQHAQLVSVKQVMQLLSISKKDRNNYTGKHSKLDRLKADIVSVAAGPHFNRGAWHMTLKRSGGSKVHTSLRVLRAGKASGKMRHGSIEHVRADGSVVRLCMIDI